MTLLLVAHQDLCLSLVFSIFPALVRNAKL